jgi:hypothetical protein
MVMVLASNGYGVDLDGVGCKGGVGLCLSNRNSLTLKPSLSHTLTANLNTVSVTLSHYNHYYLTP